MIQLKVANIALDQKNTPVVFLKEIDGDRVLPIWIAPVEAGAIAMGLSGQKFERPLTHDLLKQVVLGLGAELDRVVITSIQENTYFAQLQLSRDDHLYHVDARPSDSIALAVRFDAPIFAEESIFANRPSKIEQVPDDLSELDPDALKQYLKDLDPEDFGKFKP
jgi:bifunctional DNase/RNase